MKKHLFCLLTGPALLAGPVFFTAHSKTYCYDQSCPAIVKAQKAKQIVFTADEKVAQEHGLTPAKAQTTAVKTRQTWAKEVKQ